MRTLTDVFASGSPSVPEGLRTLEVSPNRIIEPGMTVHAAFTVRNLGGGTAKGFRVRFKLPEGLTYLVGTARVDETPLDENGGLTTLLQTSGADIGDIPAEGERRISLAYTVAPTIENGTQIALQAAVSSFEVPVIGSNVVRLVVRSRPTLQSKQTTLSFVPLREAVPGEELQLNARVHNSGQSSAHDVIVMLPVPPNTVFVPQSVAVDGRAPAAMPDTEPFGYARPTIVAPTLGPGATIDVGYRVRIDAPLDDATPIAAHGAVCSQEVPEFALKPVTLKIPSSASFTGDETGFHADCEDDVVPGQRLRLTLRARNVGTSRARNVRLNVDLPEGLTYVCGSLCIDGAPAVDRQRDCGTVAIGDLEPGRSVEIAISGVVRPPIANGRELKLFACVEWSKGKRTFERTVTARSSALFPAAFNTVERETPRRVSPGDEFSFAIRLANMGTDVASDVRVQLQADDGLERLCARDGDAEVAIGDDGMLHLETLEPNAPRTLRVSGRIAGVLEDQTQLRVRATLLRAQDAPIELGSAVHVVASRARLAAATSHLVVESTEVLRPNRITMCRLTLANEGTDRGRDVRVALQLPEELRLERVDGATRDGQCVVFGDVLAGETHEAALHLRLIGTITAGDVLTVGARVSGVNVVPFALEPIELATDAQASFVEGATLVSLPAETVDAGAEIAYALSLRNCGDGAAKRLTARVESPNHTVYAPGTTTVNDVALSDFGGTSPLLGPSGLTLADVGAGVEVIVRWRMIVNTPLPPGTPIEAEAFVTWDDAPEITVTAHPLAVRSAAALPIIEPDLPFSVLGVAAAAARPNLAVRPADAEEHKTYVELPPAVPVASNGAGSGARTNGSIAAFDYAQLLPASEATAPASTTLSLELSEESLAWTVRYIERARNGNLLSHLVVLRALLPDEVDGGDAVVRARLRRHRELLGELVDPVFIRLRLPDFELEQGDLETPELRASLTDLIEILSRQHFAATSSTPDLRLVAEVRQQDIAASVAALEEEPLLTAVPWRTLALLMGTVLVRGGAKVGDLSAYRDALQRELAGLAHVSAAEFVAALLQPADAVLDRERDVVLRALAEQQRVLN